MTTKRNTEGWAFPGHGQRTKAHYFVDGRSLCGKWGFYSGPLGLDDYASPDDCPTCRRRFEKRQAEAAGKR